MDEIENRDIDDIDKTEPKKFKSSFLKFKIEVKVLILKHSLNWKKYIKKKENR